MNVKAVNTVAWLLVLVGALNWGLVGAFDYNLVAEIFGADSTGADVVYILVGVAALYFFALKALKMSK